MKKIIASRFYILIGIIFILAVLILNFTNSVNKAISIKAEKPVALQTTSFIAPILVYHHLRQPNKNDNLSVSPQIFEQQLAWLKNNGYAVISYTDFYKALTGQKSLPKNSVVISFDDGFLDQYTIGYPLLKKYGFPAIFFIPTKKIDKRGYLSRNMLLELVKNNYEIGSHTINHQNLTKLSGNNLYF